MDKSFSCVNAESLRKICNEYRKTKSSLLEKENYERNHSPQRKDHNFSTWDDMEQYYKDMNKAEALAILAKTTENHGNGAVYLTIDDCRVLESFKNFTKRFSESSSDFAPRVQDI